MTAIAPVSPVLRSAYSQLKAHKHVTWQNLLGIRVGEQRHDRFVKAQELPLFPRRACDLVT